MNVQNIITNLRASDERIVDQAFTSLYQEYYHMIYSFIKENSGSEEDAADIFQDALIVLYDKVRREDFQLTCHIKTYIYSICRNLWLKKLNRRKQQLNVKEMLKPVDLQGNISDILEDEEDAILVARLLKEIGEDAERILIYFYFDGLSTEEVTKKMGYANEQVTRNKKSKCLKKLRTLLKESSLFNHFRS